MRIAVLTANGDLRFADPATCPLGLLQTLVSGWIEPVGLDETATMWLNEEGKLLGLPANKIANALAHAHDAIWPNDVIVGDVVIVGPPDDNGNDTALPDHWVERLTRYTAH